MSRSRVRNSVAHPALEGFTLVEVLVVMLIGSILAGLSAAMLQSARETARIARTRSIIKTIDEIITSRIEAIQSRPFPIVLPDLTTAAGSGNSRLVLPPREAARVRLLMFRDTLRMELPDRYTDLVFNNSVAVASGALEEPTQISARVLYTTDGASPVPMPASVNWWMNPSTGTYPNQNVPGVYAGYRARIPVDSGGKITWTPAYASSECLYLILSTTFMDGISAIEMLPRGHVDDVDGDQMPEIVDAWGTPIGFIRWPVGYIPVGFATLADYAAASPPEEGDLFKADFYYNKDDPPPNKATAAGSATPAPRSLRPLIVSAGPDEVFDLRFAQTPSDISYARQTWPKSVPWMGDEASGRPSGAYYYIDPFLRQSSSQLIGEGFDDDGSGDLAEQADNISNYLLMEEV